MNKYKILTRSSNGNYNHFKTVTLKDDDKADEVVNNLEDNTGFEYKWEFVESVEQEEVVIEDSKEGETVDETEEDETVDTMETVTEDDIEFVEEADEEEYPRGWHLRSEFVDKEGNVYQKGEVQPDLYRTKEPSEY